MPFFFIGLILLVVGLYFLRRAIKTQDKEGVVGMTALLVAGAILVMVFGFFYRHVTLFG